jgi:CheY-like chemotaxis protein
LQRITDATQPLQASHSESLQGARILVVDDEPDARTVVAKILSLQSAVVHTAQSAHEAFAELQRWKPDVLVSDIGMPNEDGYSLIGRVRALSESEGGATPAIALTAFATDSDQSRALSSGFQQHISKPVEPAKLITSIANLLRPD